MLNGKLTLRQAEGINNLVNAQTEKQRNSAVSQITTATQGHFQKQSAKHFQRWRDQLINCHAKIEAVLNFADEDGVNPDSQIEQLKFEVSSLSTEMDDTLRKLKRMKSMTTGICVAIVGNPNVGKSSLLNILSSKHAALVSPFEGTTRDAIEVHVDFHGWPLTFVDTAGIRETSDVIERMGVELSAEIMERADIIIHVDSLKTETHYPIGNCTEPCGTRNNRNSIVFERIPCGTRVIKVMNKIDLLSENSTNCQPGDRELSEFICVSCLTMEGIERLLGKLKSALETSFSDLDESVSLMSSVLERSILEKCIKQLDKMCLEDDEVMMAEYLKAALSEMSIACGFVLTEDVLDSVFKNFCIGK